jgi:hypothetical protein
MSLKKKNNLNVHIQGDNKIYFFQIIFCVLLNVTNPIKRKHLHIYICFRNSKNYRVVLETFLFYLFAIRKNQKFMELRSNESTLTLKHF